MAGRQQLESRKGQLSSPPSSSLWEAAQRQLFRPLGSQLSPTLGPQ